MWNTLWCLVISTGSYEYEDSITISIVLWETHAFFSPLHTEKQDEKSTSAMTECQKQIWIKRV